jgi:hypothetical protein
MRFLTETPSLRKRSVPLWLPIFALVVLSVAGLFAWIWHQSILFSLGDRWLIVGYTRQMPPGVARWRTYPTGGRIVVYLPVGGGACDLNWGRNP